MTWCRRAPAPSFPGVYERADAVLPDGFVSVCRPLRWCQVRTASHPRGVTTILRQAGDKVQNAVRVVLVDRISVGR